VIDATGMPQTAVLIGGTSEIGLAVLRDLASRRLEKVVLAGRVLPRLRAAAKELEAAGAQFVEVAELDLARPGELEAFAASAAGTLGGIDLLVMALGDLGTADLDQLSPARVTEMMTVNVTGPAAVLVAFANVMRAQGYGRLVILSSVAGVRVRKANFVYGAGKAGLDGFALGLRDALVGTGVDVMVVRPGFVRTRMTTGLPEAPFTVGPAAVAASVTKGLEAGAAVVFVPPVLRYVFLVLRVLPRAIWRRIPG
jgi:decaprenylphospho-beta-D-erythro-pentofuranosid-2-ulose 2-reductase